MSETPVERLARKLAPSGECLIWTGPLNKYGYGIGSFGGKTRLVHRVAYELHVGPIPEKYTVDHLCRNRACARAGHLELVTGRENTRRAQEANGIGAYATACPQGHPYDEENTYRDKRGFRYCRTCQRARTVLWKNKQRGGPPRPYGAAVTACIHGHPYTEENTGVRRDGRRRCRTCAREYATQRRQEKRA